MTPSLSFIGLTLLLLVNLVLFLLMGWDKRRAQRNHYRIPEKTLLLLGIAGGGAGGLLGMQLFRHKTKHGYFYVVFSLGAAIGAVCLTLL